MNHIIELILITFAPIFELRGSIPYGILKLGMNWLSVFIIAVLANIAVGVIVFLLLDWLVRVFCRFKFVKRLYDRLIARTQKNVEKYIDKWGELGLAIFIGIPLPGSGVWTGALAAYILGFKFRKFLIANIIGVLIAAVIVTILVLTGSEVFSIFVKRV